MDWVTVTKQEDLEHLDHVFGGFHDACLREMHVWTQHYVTDDLNMNVVGGLDSSSRLLFQRQFRDPSAIELWFSELTRLVWAPTNVNYDSIIEGAELTITNHGHFLLQIDMVASSPITEQKAELIVAAKRLTWRGVPWMGSQLRYGDSASAE